MDTGKTGQIMIAMGFVVGLIALTSFFGGVQERQYNPNSDPVSQRDGDSTEVALKRNRQGHYVMTGAINGAPANFLLDTGATDVVVPAEAADKLGLRRGRSGQAMTANGPVTVYETMIDELRLGEIVLYNVPASINPAMQSVGILLGMSALSRVEFSQQGDYLTLRQRH